MHPPLCTAFWTTLPDFKAKFSRARDALATNALCYPEFGGFGGFTSLIIALPCYGSEKTSEVFFRPIWQSRPFRDIERPMLDSGPKKNNTTPVACRRTPKHSPILVKCRWNRPQAEPPHFACIVFSCFRGKSGKPQQKAPADGSPGRAPCQPPRWASLSGSMLLMGSTTMVRCGHAMGPACAWLTSGRSCAGRSPRCGTVDGHGYGRAAKVGPPRLGRGLVCVPCTDGRTPAAWGRLCVDGLLPSQAAAVMFDGTGVCMPTDTVQHQAAEPHASMVCASFSGLQDALQACATPVQLQCVARAVGPDDLLDTLIAHTALDHDSTRPGKGFLPHDQPLTKSVSARLQRLVARCLLGCMTALDRRTGGSRRARARSAIFVCQECLSRRNGGVVAR